MSTHPPLLHRPRASRQLLLGAAVILIGLVALLGVAINARALAAKAVNPKTGLYTGSTSQGDNMIANFKVLEVGGGHVVGANIFLRVPCPGFPLSAGAYPLRSKGAGDPSLTNLGGPVPIAGGKFRIDRTINEPAVNSRGASAMKVRISGIFKSAKVILGTVTVLEYKVAAKGSIPAHNCPSIDGVTYTSRHP